MKVRPERVRNLIKLDKDFASIEDIDLHGRIVYDLSLYADIFSCLRNDVITVRVTAYKKSPITRTPVFHRERSSRDVISGLKTHFSRRKGRIKRSRKSPIAVLSIDISRVISNEIARKSRVGKKQFQKILGLRPVVRAVPTADLTDHTNPPELTVPIKSRDDIDSAFSPRTSAIKTIIRDGIDPSSIADDNFPMISLRESVQGVKSGNFAVESRVKRRRRRSAGKSMRRSRVLAKTPGTMATKNSRESASLRAHLGSKNMSSTNRDFIERTKIIRTMMFSRWERVDDELAIDRRKLKNIKSFYILFEVIDKSGKIVDTFARKIDHEEHLTEYLTPDKPPIIKVKRSVPGQNVLVVSQRDEVATSVSVYRRFVDTSSPTMEGRYKIIGTVSVTKDEGEVRLDDMVNNTRLCLYRAIAIGPRGHRCPRFHGAVSRPVPISIVIPAKKRDMSDPSHISVFAETVRDSVRIRLTNIPDGPTCVYVVAYDLSVDKMRRNRRIVGSNLHPEEQTQSVGIKTVDLIFTDKAVKDRHIYEYRCVMLYPNGKERTSVSYEVHEFRRNITLEPVVMSLGKPELRMDETGIVSLSFDIGARFTESGIENVLEAMESAGITGAYLAEINRDRRKFNSLLSFLVIRQESVSGETETFGRQGMGRFIDDLATRAAMGVSEMLPGRSYRYVVQLLVRDAETLFDDLVSESVDVEKQSRFKRKMSKFFNPTTLQEGILPSTAAASGRLVGARPNASHKFQSGRTAVFQSIDVSVPRRRIGVANLTVSQTSHAGRCLIQWDIEGDESRIDHFLVIKMYRGAKGPLGNVHHESSDGSYQFFDRQKPLVGTTAYSVVPVLTNFVYGKESDPVVVNIDSSEPSFTLES